MGHWEVKMSSGGLLKCYCRRGAQKVWGKPLKRHNLVEREEKEFSVAELLKARLRYTKHAHVFTFHLYCFLLLICSYSQ